MISIIRNKILIIALFSPAFIIGTLYLLNISYNSFGCKIAFAQDTPSDSSLNDIQSVLDSLEGKKKAIEQEKEMVEQEKRKLELVKQEIESKIQELSNLNNQIEANLKKISEIETTKANQQKAEEEVKIKQLVKVYTTMKPKTAAGLIDKLEIDVVMKIFQRMKGDQIAQILAYVNQDRAAKISELLASEQKPQ
ncbi:MAG: hypothetical protein HQK76_01990 [Desulfobacterales bacterium]|nr:hypothetical protein [Desulfobacterales bacterium]